MYICTDPVNACLFEIFDLKLPLTVSFCLFLTTSDKLSFWMEERHVCDGLQFSHDVTE